MIGRWTVLNGVLLVLAVLLGVQIARTWIRTVPPVRVPAPAADSQGQRREVKAKPGTPREPTDDMVAVIASMDLFDMSRQPAGTTTAATVVTEVPPPTGIELIGIRLLGRDQEALIRDQSQQNAQRRVRTGDEVSGYTVQAINATNVELANDNGQQVTLWLQLSPSKGAARPAAGSGGQRPQPVTPQPLGAAPRPGAAPPPPAATPPVDPRAAERQRVRQQRLERQRGGAVRPNLPPGVQEQLRQMRKGA